MLSRGLSQSCATGFGSPLPLSFTTLMVSFHMALSLTNYHFWWVPQTDTLRLRRHVVHSYVPWLSITQLHTCISRSDDLTNFEFPWFQHCLDPLSPFLALAQWVNPSNRDVALLYIFEHCYTAITCTSRIFLVSCLYMFAHNISLKLWFGSLPQYLLSYQGKSL